MHYAAKLSTSRLPLPKMAASVLSSRFPAWIDSAAAEVVRASSACVMPRVRDSLVLRLVSKGKAKPHVRRSA